VAEIPEERTGAAIRECGLILRGAVHAQDGGDETKSHARMR
jgi:hypothetical protein